VDGTTLVLCGMKFSIVSRRAAYVRNPPGVKEQAAWGLRKVSESTFNRALLVPFAVTSRHFRDVRINQRIDSLPCPALFSMFPGRLVRSAGTAPAGDAASTDADSTKQRRSACAGSNYVWIMRVVATGLHRSKVGSG
jgi:hypothetical protein